MAITPVWIDLARLIFPEINARAHAPNQHICTLTTSQNNTRVAPGRTRARLRGALCRSGDFHRLVEIVPWELGEEGPCAVELWSISQCAEVRGEDLGCSERVQRTSAANESSDAHKQR